ncbi:hypothetical protein C4J81_13090 [Deltaproteobacteria bacterium Smac51]|nr:hypothetical protein C4J81_13090 [Deltaproteobacteria bacterium Smac51]
MLAVNLDLRNKTVLLVGGGAVGCRKLTKVIRYGAFVRVVEPDPNPYLRKLAKNKFISLHNQFEPELLDGVSLAFIATSDSELNLAAAQAARGRGIWVNMADNPREGDFFLPAVVNRGPFRLTVSTGGGGPALAAIIAERLREIFGPEYGRLASLLGILRPYVLASGLEEDERRAVFNRLAESEELLRLIGRQDTAAQAGLIKTMLPPDIINDEQLMQAIMEAAAD